MKPAAPPAQDHPFTGEVMRDLFTNHELLAREAHRPKISAEEGAGAVCRVGILGGGTAGWFTALALRAQLPSLEVTVIETPSIPIIGVGEASVPSLVPFLHHYLKLDVAEFTREVAPTWKQGIRFEWGLPGDYVFQAPFDWEVNGIGMLGAMAETANVSAFTLQGQLMAKDVTPIIRTQSGKLHSFLPVLAFAYHLDNQRLVAYLRKTAIARGITHLDAKIVDAKLAPAGAEQGADPLVEHLVDDGGREHAFDLYVDCSGFRSFLLGEKLGAPFTSYASTLFTDRALAFNAPHAGKLKPYTTARTMQAGWCWDIPIREDDHLGYVYSSNFLGDDAALAEAKAIWPDMKGERVVKFRSGRHDRLWVGNVFAVGNAYAFVEPLESTGLLMITRAITSLVRSFPMRDARASAATRRFVNDTVGRDWDRLRWFLAAHYKFNRRFDSPFWREVRETCDISGLEHALALFRELGPLSLTPRAVRASLQEDTGIFFYGLHGLDCILLGQKVPFADVERGSAEAWRARNRTAKDFVRRAIPQADALRAVNDHPEWIDQLVNHPAGWVMKMLPFL
ncbi:MAG: tryptophan halogenase family protein [Polyangiaceae bacterium]